MERYIAIDNVCAWPSLTLLSDGTILAVIYNRPRHGDVEGEVECWASGDGGRSWQYRGTPVRHQPDTSRINCACGLSRDGSFLVLVSGWHLKEWQPIRLPAVCRSRDAGSTWTRDGRVVSNRRCALVPYGPVLALPDGCLGVFLYGTGLEFNRQAAHSSFFFVSDDDGRTWRFRSAVSENANETYGLVLPDGSLLAVSRTDGDEHLESFLSDDCGRLWRNSGPVTMGGQHPGHLLLLADGRVLLTCGIRTRGLRGIGGRFFIPESRRWDASWVLVDFHGRWEAGYPENVRMKPDCGYPSSVQMDDGTIVTAYYASKVPCHHRYHMGVVRWRIDEEF